MKSGGVINFDATKAKDTPGGDRTRWSENELKTGLSATSGENLNDMNETTQITWNGLTVTWGQLRQLLSRPIRAGQAVADNITPQELLQQNRGAMDAEAGRLVRELKALKDAQTGNKDNVDIPGGNLRVLKANFADAIAERKQRLQFLVMQMEQANASSATRSAINSEYYHQADLTEPSGTGNGGGGQFQARAMTGLPGNAPQGASGGGATGQNPQARGMGMPGAGIYGYGDPTFGGMQPPSSAAYAMALYNDSVISEGLGSVLRSSSEGRKLMMLFFYYARMAESGDLGAMYQFMKFLTHVIAKDKARQNIQMGTKLIQLQDMDRKATEALMSAPSDDPNKMNEFTKILQQTQSEQRMISMSQKLIADMSQEFAHVQEALISLTKAMQESWARALRIETSK